MKNKLKIAGLLLGFIIVSCSGVNEFGSRRNKFSLEKIKPNKDTAAYTIIDTSKIYRLVNITITSDEKVSNDMNARNEQNPTYLKFYKNGRVGEFMNVDLNNMETLNPKRAWSHLYRLKKGKFVIQDYFKSAQCGECFVKRTLTKDAAGQLILTSEDHIYTYKAVEIPRNFLIYKPDW